MNCEISSRCVYIVDVLPEVMTINCPIVCHHSVSSEQLLSSHGVLGMPLVFEITPYVLGLEFGVVIWVYTEVRVFKKGRNLSLLPAFLIPTHNSGGESTIPISHNVFANVVAYGFLVGLSND